MNGEELELIGRSVESALEQTRDQPWSTGWDVLVGLGYHQIGVPEACGGAGGGLAEVAAVVEAAGYAAATVPLVETSMLAAPVLASAGIEHVARSLMESGAVAAITVPTSSTTPVHMKQLNHGWQVEGSWRRVAFAAAAPILVVLAEEDRGFRLAALPSGEAGVEIRPGCNLANEPRDDVVLSAVHVADDLVSAVLPDGFRSSLLEGAALGRTLALCGALRRTRELTVQYAGQRVQFGRPLRTFQAIQRHLAQIEGWVRGTEVACRAAVEAHDSGDPFAVAAARYWASRAAREVFRAAHQVHGAIGVTHELDLHRSTTRLVAWASEYGNEAFWAARAGDHAGRGDDPNASWRQ